MVIGFSIRGIHLRAVSPYQKQPAIEFNLLFYSVAYIPLSAENRSESIYDCLADRAWVLLVEE